MMTPTLNHRYKVIKVLASGGFGETFLAEDTQMPSKRKCVIKQLKPIEHNPQIYDLLQERFQREAAILEELSDGKNQIPQLYAYFIHNEQFYLVQEYIEGETLTDKLRKEGILSETSVKGILINILPVLEYIHSKHIVHRDIKPDNILIRHGDRKPVLIDFGAVKEAMQTVMAGSNTKSIVIGTPGFMPAEQTAGRPTYSSDLYSLGLTAIYLLTGKIPQELSSSPSTSEIIWQNYIANITPDFAAVLDKAIKFHPKERFSTATEMLKALQMVGVTSLPPTVPQLSTTSIKKKILPETVISIPSPRIQSQPSTMILSGGMKDWQKATIIGCAIGLSVVGGMAIINKQPSAIQANKTIVKNDDDSYINTKDSVKSLDNYASQSANLQALNQTQLSRAALITRDEAISIVNRWQDAKQVLFAPPFNRSLGAELTTGEAYRKNISSGSSLEWLESNNAYYRYGVQRIDSVGNFIASDDRATIEMTITEDRKFYKDGQIIPGENTELDTRIVRYSLQLENGSLKISDYETINVISSR
ncbi:protein kinase domain-containing protein [Rivularia sp. UHCC 0363]|uniref:protein kinase domain-containing protein n=1 Tax=Rivularia sp. UHCC 0363 TaxID=3110244 RepID=UPI003A599665